MGGGWKSGRMAALTKERIAKIKERDAASLNGMTGQCMTENSLKI